MASLFTKILNGEIPGQFVHKDEVCFAIKDIQPEGPVHVLIIPRKEIKSIDDTSVEDQLILGHLLVVAGQIARQLGVSENGYRLVASTGAHACQSVPHLHIHLIGGRQMTWPPG